MIMMMLMIKLMRMIMDAIESVADLFLIVINDI